MLSANKQFNFLPSFSNHPQNMHSVSMSYLSLHLQDTINATHLHTYKDKLGILHQITTTVSCLDKIHFENSIKERSKCAPLSYQISALTTLGSVNNHKVLQTIIKRPNKKSNPLPHNNGF